LKIAIICSSAEHPINPLLERWQEQQQPTHDVQIVRHTNKLQGGDVLFLVSCTEVVSKQVRNKYEHCLVLHASDLPRGRGWSPHIWEILNGAQELTVSILDADDPVDSGAIWAKISFPVPKHALYDEINEQLFRTELLLMDRALQMIAAGEQPTPQPDDGISYWPRRNPDDSEIDPYQPLANQFDKVRVSDLNRYPAFFWLHGQRYKIEIEKIDDNEPD
jgi:methionyl-tRNA formyltransferase